MEPAPPPPDDSILYSALADFEAEERRRVEAEADAKAKARGRDEHSAPAAPQTPAAAQLGAAGKAGAARGADEKAADAVLEGLGSAQQATPAAAASSGAGAGAGPSPEEFAKNISALLKELSLADKADGKQDEVKSGIEKTLASLAESAKKLEEQSAAGGGGDSEAVLEKLLEQFGSNTEFQGMMENMVQQLMSKDIMYGPLKEMRDKYPEWLQKNAATLSEADAARYQKQAGLIGNICDLYEREPVDMQRIMALMQEMQDCGQPPQDIIKELAPDAAPDLAAGAAGGAGGAADPNCVVM